MKLLDLISPDCIVCPLRAREKESALYELAETVSRATPDLSPQQIVDMLQARERQGPFSMGKSVAFPHARIDSVRELRIAIGTSPAGIDFQAPDGNLIRVIILFLLPRRHSNLYLQTLATFLSYFTNERTLERAATAGSPEKFLALIRELESAPPRPSPLEDLIQPTPFLRANQSVAHAIETALASRDDRIPVVDPQGTLEGEVALSALLGFSTPEYKAKPIRELGKVLIRPPGLVVEDTTDLADLADRLSREDAPVAYVVRNGRLIGRIHPVDLLRKMISR